MLRISVNDALRSHRSGSPSLALALRTPSGVIIIGVNSHVQVLHTLDKAILCSSTFPLHSLGVLVDDSLRFLGCIVKLSILQDPLLNIRPDRDVSHPFEIVISPRMIDSFWWKRSS